MKGDVLSSVEAAAFGAKVAGVEIVPHFPAPFSVEIAKKLSKIHNCDIFEVESAGSAVSAAIGAATAGKRVFMPASSPLAQEVFAAPAMRLPFMIANVSRSLHGIKVDHTAVLALRDAGYMMFFPESNQEIHDTIIQAYRVSEDSKVMLPSIINIDGLPNFSEPVQVAADASVKSFLPKLRGPKLVSNKLHFDLYSDKYDEIKIQQSKCMDAAIELLKKVDEKWKQKFHRGYGLVDRYMMDDAEIAIVTMGYHSSTAKAAANKMRAAGKKVGVLRLRVFRPWPRAAVEAALANVKKVIVFDQAVSIGVGGILRAHVGKGSSLICLGKYPSEKDFMDAVARVEKSEKDLRLWL